MAEGGGGGPSGPIVIQPGRGGDRGNFWSRNTGILGGLFLGPSQLKPYQEKSWLRKTLGASFSEALWQTKEGRTQLMQAGYELWRATKLANPESSEYRRTYGKPGDSNLLRDLRKLEKLRSHAAPPQDPVPRQPGGTQRTPGSVNQSARDQFFEALQRLAEWYAQRQQQVAAEREARRQRKAQQMALGDIVSQVLGGVTQLGNAAAPAVTAYLNARSASRGSASGVPLSLVGGGGGGLPMDLGGILSALSNTGPLEEGGILEGLENDVNRDVVLWQRTGGVLGGGRAHPVRQIYGRNPDSGAIGVWGYLGKPVLYTGDLATCKRVNRIARRAAGRVGLRFRRRGRR